jgi:hypothetical protein
MEKPPGNERLFAFSSVIANGGDGDEIVVGVSASPCITQ